MRPSRHTRGCAPGQGLSAEFRAWEVGGRFKTSAEMGLAWRAGKAQSVFDSYMGMCARSRNQNEGRLKPSLVPTLHSFNLYMRSLLA